MSWKTTIPVKWDGDEWSLGFSSVMFLFTFSFLSSIVGAGLVSGEH